MSLDETKEYGMERPVHLMADILSALSRQRRIAVATFVILASFALLLIALLPRQYEAEMKILVNNDRPSQVVTPEASVPRAQTDVDETQINSEIDLMTNNGLLKRVAEQTVPQTRKTVNEAHIRAIEKQVKALKNHIHVELARKSDIIEVTYADREPQRAELILRCLLADYLDAHTQAHATPGTYTFFKKQAEDFRQQLTQVDGHIEQVEAQGGALDLAQKEDLLVKGREDTQAALLATTANMQADENRLSQGQTTYAAEPSLLETESRSIPNQYSIEHMSTLLVELRNKRADLLTNFPITDRQVQILERQISITEGALTAAVRDENIERVTGPNPARQSLETALTSVSMSLAAERARRGALSNQVGFYDRRLASLAALKLQYETLERQHKELEDSYLLYAHKEEEARAAEALDAQRFSNIAVVEAPLAFHIPSQPKVALDLVLSWLLAFCIALFVALATDRYWAGVQDANTLEEITGLPVISVLPVARSW